MDNKGFETNQPTQEVSHALIDQCTRVKFMFNVTVFYSQEDRSLNRHAPKNSRRITLATIQSGVVSLHDPQRFVRQY